MLSGRIIVVAYQVLLYAKIAQGYPVAMSIIRMNMKRRILSNE
jgi:hypothetical protein